jgi:hypothetical protein
MTLAEPQPAPLRPVVMRRIVFVAVWIAVFVFVGHEELVGPDELTGVELLVRFSLALLLTFWCALDGRVRGKPVPRIGLLSIFITTPFGVLVYGVWSRGWRGLLFDLGLVVLYMITGMASMYLVYWATDRPLP